MKKRAVGSNKTLLTAPISSPGAEENQSQGQFMVQNVKRKAWDMDVVMEDHDVEWKRSCVDNRPSETVTDCSSGQVAGVGET